MIHKYPVQLTTLEEDFRAIGLLPAEKELREVDDSTEPRDIPSPDPSTDTGSDMQAMPARHRYAKQPKPRMAPDETDDHDDPLEAGATQKGKTKASGYHRVQGGKEATLEDVDTPLKGYTLLKNKIMQRASDMGKPPAVAQGLAPVKDSGLKYPKKKVESANVNRAAELVGEVEALLRGSQMGEDARDLAHGFGLIGENCALLAQRLVDIAEHYEVDSAIDAMESLYNGAIEACEIIESAGSAGDYEEDEELDLDGLKEAFRIMTLSLMDAVEAYDATIAEASEKDDEDDDDDDDSDDDDDGEGDDDEGDDDEGGMAARMAKLKAMKGKKGPFGK